VYPKCRSRFPEYHYCTGMVLDRTGLTAGIIAEISVQGGLGPLSM